MAVRVGADDVEVARWRLLEECPAGIEEVELDDLVELAAYVDGDGEARVRAAFGHVAVDPVEAGWEDRWRAFHRPVVVGGVWIGPPWETPPPSLPAVVIDPGRAFGTGAHPTTRLCIELLSRVGRGSLIDVGCGSGVLALAAARLGFGPIVAVDDDPIAVELTGANARTNGIDLDARAADALHDTLPAAEVAVANVLLRPVEAILARVPARVVVTSGYLESEVPAHTGWVAVDRLEEGGWAADSFERVAPAPG